MVLRPLLQAYKRHLRHFYDDFDPIKDVTLDQQNLATSRLVTVANQNRAGAKTSSHPIEQFLSSELKDRSKGHYLVGLVTIFYVGVDTLHILAQNGVILSSLTRQTNKAEKVANIPELFTHRIFPRTFWPQADIIAFVCLLLAAAFYGLLWWRPLMLDVGRGACWFALRDSATGEVVRLVDVGGEELPPKLASKLLHFRSLARQSVSYLMLALVATMELYFAQQVYWKSLYGSPADLLFYFAYLPLMLSYAVLADVVLIFFFVITNRYLVLQQTYLLTQMEQLDSLTTTTFEEVPNSKTALQKQAKPNIDHLAILISRWRLVAALTGQVNRLATELEALNRFWSVHATLFFLGYIVLVAYFAYSFFFIDSSWEKKAFFSLFFFDDAFVLFFVIAQSAVVVRQYGSIVERHEAFCRYFVVAKETRLLKGKVFLTANCFLLNRKRKDGFRFVNDWLIDSNVLVMTLYYLTTLFMLIINDESGGGSGRRKL